MKIFVVKGYSGEYGDSVEWVCKCFKSLVKAESFREELKIAGDIAYLKSGKGFGGMDFLDEKYKQYIKHFDYNGVWFDIEIAEYDGGK